MPNATLLRPLWDRANEWACRLEMIREAREFLYLSTFYLEYDSYGVELLAALRNAQQRGVAVNLLIDGFGQLLGGVLMTADQKQALEKQLDGLSAAGAVVTTYRPQHFLQRRLGGGQHVKIQVSEAGEAIFGSSNVTQSSFEGWNEYSVSLGGPIAQALLASYREIGGLVADSHLDRLREVSEAAAGASDREPIALDYWLCNPNHHQGWLGPLARRWRSGRPGENLVTDRMVTMIESARESIELTSFFFKPIPKLLSALLDAVARGVRIEIHHSHRDALPATDLAWIAAATGYERLLKAGIEIFENRHGEHSKIVLVDRAWVAFGSYNFEDAAHDRLAEAMLATRDARAVEPAVAIFEELRRDRDNLRVTSESLRDLPKRVRRRLALFGRFKRWM